MVLLHPGVGSTAPLPAPAPSGSRRRTGSVVDLPSNGHSPDGNRATGPRAAGRSNASSASASSRTGPSGLYGARRVARDSRGRPRAADRLVHRRRRGSRSRRRRVRSRACAETSPLGARRPSSARTKVGGGRRLPPRSLGADAVFVGAAERVETLRAALDDVAYRVASSARARATGASCTRSRAARATSPCWRSRRAGRAQPPANSRRIAEAAPRRLPP